ncbi:hypothetical protein [Proteus mirabilis]|uniref:hypothetical protein n=1 Tax=Proteus mirabilis TaxID=584 RepID=UPI001F32071D|nr:hypothetical protein [Proteus mirabilis]
MSVIKKPDLKIFAQDAKTGEIETFPDVLRGWGITLERTAGKPPLEWFNAIGKRVDEWLMYLTQRGLAEWDNSVDYPKDALVQHLSVFYVALKVTKGEQPNTSQNAWTPLVNFLGVNNKLDKTAVVQSTGTSTTSVMSQKASTDAFQPKGMYPTTSEMNVELNKKVDKASISQQLANDVNKVPSLDLLARELGNKQGTGNYADGNAFVSGSDNKEIINGDSRVTLRKSGYYQIYLNNTIRFNLSPNGVLSNCNFSSSLINDLAQTTGISTTSVMSQKASTDSFQPKGSYQASGYSYSKSESDGKYQPKGNYATAGSSYTKAESDGRYNKKQKIFRRVDSITNPIETGNVVDLSEDVRGKYLYVKWERTSDFTMSIIPTDNTLVNFNDRSTVFATLYTTNNGMKLHVERNSNDRITQIYLFD